MKRTDWHSLSAEETARLLRTNLHDGLTRDQSSARIRQARNLINPPNPTHPLKRLFAQFTDTMVLVLLGATILSAILGDLIDALTILTIVVINGVLGFIQEYRAEKSLDEIKRLSAPFAAVVRDGKRIRIEADEVVSGDLLWLEAGDKVAADMRLTDANNLEIEESCLTGESIPVRKDANRVLSTGCQLGDQVNMAFSSTVVTRGHGRGVVVSTGMDTVLGQIARMIQEKEPEPTLLQKRLDHLGKVLIVVCLTACLAVTGLGITRGENIMRMLMAGISLGVAAIPEGLPAIVTVVLALGVQRMAKRKAIVRKLPAVETLGCTTVICSDKTGTLTRNQMTVRRAATASDQYEITGEGYGDQGQVFMKGQAVDAHKIPELQMLARIAFHCNRAEIAHEKGRDVLIGDPTEGALLSLGLKCGFKKKKEILREIPFDSDRKRMSAVVEEDKQMMVLTKGALEVILPLCKTVLVAGSPKPITHELRKRFIGIQEQWAEEAYRVLALAAVQRSASEVRDMQDMELERGLCLVGICAMMDPPRESVAMAVADCRSAGIIPVMITGDHPGTALAVARQIGIYDRGQVLGPEDIDQLNGRALADRTLETRVLARVSPEHKLKVVKALREAGHVVAMTGDGVNDAPAVKEADIGISMGISGTEVTKEASAMILADDDFATIVAAVREGRGIYDNIRKFVRYLLGCNIGEVLTMFAASLIGMPLPMLPIQILWVNLVTDGLPAMALGLEPAEPQAMRRGPRKRDEQIFSRGLGWRIIGRGLFIAAATLSVFIFGLMSSELAGAGDLTLARTMAFTTLVFAQLFFVFECRSETASPFELGFGSNKYLLAAAASSVVMQLAVIYYAPLAGIFGTHPLTGPQWVVVLLVSGCGFFLKMSQHLLRKLVGTRPKYDKLKGIELYNTR